MSTERLFFVFQLGYILKKNHRFFLSWPPESLVDLYGCVQLFPLPCQGPDLECLCDGLHPGTQYRVRVSCVSDGGVSPYSELCHVTTEPVCPGRCERPRLQVVGGGGGVATGCLAGISVPWAYMSLSTECFSGIDSVPLGTGQPTLLA